MLACSPQTMWIERTSYVTAYHFPGILKWFEVKSVSVVREWHSHASASPPALTLTPVSSACRRR